MKASYVVDATEVATDEAPDAADHSEDAEDDVEPMEGVGEVLY